MGQCRWCGKKGFLVFVGRRGLCSKCTIKVSKEIQYRLKVVSEAKNTLDTATDPQVKEEQTQLIIEELNHLLPFEQNKLVEPGTFSDLLKITKDQQAQLSKRKSK